MARTTNVDAVITAIIDAYQKAGDHEPSALDIIATSGVSSATYYRIVQKDPQAQATLAAARAAFAAATNAPDPDEDPIGANPHKVVRELKAVIATLLAVVEEQQRRITRLEGTQTRTEQVVPISRSRRATQSQGQSETPPF